MAHRFYVPELPPRGPLELPTAEARHAAVVLRLGPGDSLELFDGKGGGATAHILAADRRSVRCEILSYTVDNAAASVAVTLCVPLPKGDRSRWMIEKATELGVRRVVPLGSQRSVVVPKQSTLERLQRTVVEACKQCGRNRLMEIAPPCKFADLFQRRSTPAPDPASACWIAHPHVATQETQEPAVAATEHWIAIGPEGGFTDDELAAATCADWQPLALGPHILRIETAALAAAAVMVNRR